MNVRRRSWALAHYGLVIALLALGASMLLYPGGTVLDPLTHGYSFTRNFLSDLGSTVTFSEARNPAGALLFAAAMLIGVIVLAGSFVGAVRLLSAQRGRAFARLAALAGVLTCAGFLGVALTPEDRAFHLHQVSNMVAFRSFLVATALLAVATVRDTRFRRRASVGWGTLTLVLVGSILMAHLGPSTATERGLITQVITQKIMTVTILAVLWLESSEAKIAASKTRFVSEPVVPAQ